MTYTFVTTRSQSLALRTTMMGVQPKEGKKLLYSI